MKLNKIQFNDAFLIQPLMKNIRGMIKYTVILEHHSLFDGLYLHFREIEYSIKKELNEIEKD